MRVASAAAARESSAAVTAAVEIDDHREEPANIHNINNFPDMCIIRQGFAQLPAILVARCRSRWLASSNHLASTWLACTVGYSII